jgi:hypothetical protein
MKRALLIIGILFTLGVNAHAAWNAAKPADNDQRSLAPAQIRANWDAIALGTDAALLITNAKISASAAIADTKLATISTAGKVSGAALTSLSSVPSGAGALPIANGGTGATTRQSAINGLSAVSLTGTSGQGLVSDGTNMVIGYPAGLTIADAATGDVLLHSGTTWTRLAPGTTDYALVSNGAGTAPAYEKVSLTAGVQGALPVANGGTGATTAQTAIDALLPAQGSASGKVLTSNGTTASWSASGLTNYTTGNYIEVISTATGSMASSSSYTKIKEFSPLMRAGTIRVVFTSENLGPNANGYARVYINGVAVGTERLTEDLPATHTEDFSVAVGDLVQVYARKIDGGQSTATVVTSFSIRCSNPTVPSQVL